MGDNDHWLPGGFADEVKIQNIDYSRVPENIPLKEMLLETHKAFHVQKYFYIK
jgi:hypothetical protein